jgi:hypothetical protein
MNQDNRGQSDDRDSSQRPASVTKAQTSGGGQGRGFAGMDPKKQRAIASEGGKAAHASGNAHEFTSEEARRAGALSHGGRGRRAGPATPPEGTEPGTR